jgi:hypothetical protein
MKTLKVIAMLMLIGLAVMVPVIWSPQNIAEMQRQQLDAQNAANLEATRIAVVGEGQAQLQLDQARANHVLEVQREAAQIQADTARQVSDIRADEFAKIAATARDVIVWAAFAIGALLFFWGFTRAIVLWASNRASQVYPNEAGQWPVLVQRDMTHDINRMPVSTLQVLNPSLRDKWLALKAGQPLPQPQVVMVAPLDAQSQLQVTTQSQAISIMAGATRGGGDARLKTAAIEKADKLMHAETAIEPMPRIVVLDDDAEVERIAALIGEGSR